MVHHSLTDLYFQMSITSMFIFSHIYTFYYNGHWRCSNSAAASWKKIRRSHWHRHTIAEETTRIPSCLVSLVPLFSLYKFISRVHLDYKTVNTVSLHSPILLQFLVRDLFFAIEETTKLRRWWTVPTRSTRVCVRVLLRAPSCVNIQSRWICGDGGSVTCTWKNNRCSLFV